MVRVARRAPHSRARVELSSADTNAGTIRERDHERDRQHQRSAVRLRAIGRERERNSVSVCRLSRASSDARHQERSHSLRVRVDDYCHRCAERDRSSDGRSLLGAEDLRVRVSIVDPKLAFYRGDSQGGIFGATYMAISTDVTRGLLGETGAPYTLLLDRSVDFSGFKFLLKGSYPLRRRPTRRRARAPQRDGPSQPLSADWRNKGVLQRSLQRHLSSY